MDSINEIMQLCRLCLVKDEVNIPIFEEEGDIRQIFLKISACLPVKVSKEDNLPKNICDGCSSKLEVLYQFWNTSANSEKKLIKWLSQDRSSDRHSMGIDPVVLKQEVVEVPDDRSSPDNMLPDDLNVSNDEQEYLIQQQQLPYQNVEFQFQQDDYEETGTAEGAPVDTEPPSRKRRAAAIRAIANMGSEDEGNPDLLEPKIAKTEEESEESCNEDAEPTFVGLPPATDNEQPGPSGVGKQSADAPSQPYTANCKDICRMKAAVVILERMDTSLITKCAKNDKEEFLNVFGSIYTKPSYSCTTCNEKFDDSLKLKRHNVVHKMKKHEPAKRVTYNCYICLKRFKDRTSLWNHMRSHSQIRSARRCKYCATIFKSIRDLTQHMDTCLKNKKSSQPKSSKEKAPETVVDRQVAPPQFKCCHQIFHSFDLLSAHMYHTFSLSHESRCFPQYICSVCSTTFNDRTDWWQHSIKRHGCDENTLRQWSKSVTCDFCSQAFSDAIKVIQHKLGECDAKRSPKGGKFQKKVVSILFRKTTDSLQAMYNIGTKTRAPLDDPKPLTFVSLLKKTPKPRPDAETEKENDVIVVDESDEEVKDQPVENLYECKLCPFKSVDFFLLEQHCKGTHNIPYICPKCTNWYMSLDLYNQHCCQVRLS